MAGRGTVLVVDDEAMIRAVAERVLTRAGYRVLVAESAEAALEVAARAGSRIDLLFTDIVMPGMRGTELARMLQAAIPGLRVLLTSGYSTEDVDAVVGPDTEFVPKPYSPAVLEGRIGLLLTSRSNALSGRER